MPLNRRGEPGNHPTNTCVKPLRRLLDDRHPFGVNLAPRVNGTEQRGQGGGGELPQNVMRLSVVEVRVLKAVDEKMGLVVGCVLGPRPKLMEKASGKAAGQGRTWKRRSRNVHSRGSFS